MKAQLFDITHTTTYDYRSPVTVAHHLLRLAPRRLRAAVPARARARHHTRRLRPCTGTPITSATRSPSPSSRARTGSLRVTARSRVAVGARLHPGRRGNPGVGKRSQLMPDGPFGAGARRQRIHLRLPARAAGAAFHRLRRGSPSPPDAPSSRRCSTSRRASTANSSSIRPPRPWPRRWPRCWSNAGACARTSRTCRSPACARWACPRATSAATSKPCRPPGQAKLLGADASHAWVSFFCPGLGWIDVDPTNNLLPFHAAHHARLGPRLRRRQPHPRRARRRRGAHPQRRRGRRRPRRGGWRFPL